VVRVQDGADDLSASRRHSFGISRVRARSAWEKRAIDMQIADSVGASQAGTGQAPVSPSAPIPLRYEGRCTVPTNAHTASITGPGRAGNTGHRRPVRRPRPPLAFFAAFLPPPAGPDAARGFGHPVASQGQMPPLLGRLTLYRRTHTSHQKQTIFLSLLTGSGRGARIGSNEVCALTRSNSCVLPLGRSP